MQSVKKYDPGDIEKRWQKKWSVDDIYAGKDFGEKPKSYVLVEFPFLSGEGLHVGHCLSYITQDTIARWKRMQGENVLYPIGWDAFGLPTENFAIKNKIPPQEVTAKNIKNFKRQIQSLGISFDWSREVNTADPSYYKWTQWIFLQLFKKGLAEKKEVPINWCPKDKIGLAFEEVIDGTCERCGTQTEKRVIKQWVLKITKYADRLIDDLDTVDYLPEIKRQQINWIGRSEGAEIEFGIKNEESSIKIFTTRPDTLFGATYVVLSPEHPMIEQLKGSVSNWKDVQKYIVDAKKKSERERQESKEKTGVELKGTKAINPANKEEIPIWVADYVSSGYGTGAIMAVPAHDERDFEFAKKFDLQIKETVILQFGKKLPKSKRRDVAKAVIIRDNRVLVVVENGGSYSLPGGAYEDGESDDMTLSREIKEETGHAIDSIGEYLGCIECYYYSEHSKINRVRRVKAYRVSVKEPLIERHTDVDGSRSQWMNVEEAIKKISFGKFKGEEEFIKRALSGKGLCYPDEGILIGSGKFDNMSSEKAREAITKSVGGKKTVQYKLRDWIFSRQHYWGEPIPIIICEICGYMPLDEKDLPLELPKVEYYEPTDTGESPLAKITEWVNVQCPKCGGAAKRETDTMPNWAGSSWYFLRYADPHNDKKLADLKKLKYWLPVDLYNGGAEHTTLHLLYSRFWHKFLYDIKAVPTSEPYQRRVQHGMVLGPDGQKMSKSRGNVINPDDIVEKYGADAFRLYILFMGEYDKVKTWSDESLHGVWRFMKRFWDFMSQVSIGQESTLAELSLVHQTIKRVIGDMERRSFNTIVSNFMICLNGLQDKTSIGREAAEDLIRLSAPFVPHFAEEIWHAVLGHTESVHLERFPKVVERYIQTAGTTVGVQVNGKVRAELTVTGSMTEKEVRGAALALPAVAKHIDGKPIKKFIYVKEKIISIVV